jgi:hypothetical protein
MVRETMAYCGRRDRCEGAVKEGHVAEGGMSRAARLRSLSSFPSGSSVSPQVLCGSLLASDGMVSWSEWRL